MPRSKSSKKNDTKKESRVEKELEKVKETKKENKDELKNNESKSCITDSIVISEVKLEKSLEDFKIEDKKEYNKDDKKEIMERFATQRVSSIQEELEKSNLRKIELEKLKEQQRKAIEEEQKEDEEDESKEDAKKNNTKKKKKKSLIFRLFRFFFILGVLGIIALAILLYGPWQGFRDWYITCAMTTMNHQWLATMFYSQETIDDVMSRNKVIEVDGITDNTLINTTPVEQPKQEYLNEYEKAVLEKDPNHEDYKLIPIEGKGYNGYLAVVYDASKIHTMVTSKLGVVGEYVTDMAKKQGAVLAINGGGFDDPNYSSNGGTPTGITIARGELLTSRNNAGSVGGLVGFNKDNVLTLGRMTASQAKELGIRDGSLRQVVLY